MNHTQRWRRGLLLFTLAACISVYLPAQSAPVFSIGDQTTQFGEIIDVDITVQDFSEILSTQFTMNWDTMMLRFVSIDNVALGLTVAENFGTMGVSQGLLTYFYYDEALAGSELPDQTALFTVALEVIASPEPGSNLETQVTFGNVPTLIEVVDTSFTPIVAEFVGGNITILGPTSVWSPTLTEEFSVAEALPNPFREETQVQFTLAHAGEVWWGLRDVQGRLVQHGRQAYGPGTHALKLVGDHLPAAGAYWLTLQHEQAVVSRRIVFLGQ